MADGNQAGGNQNVVVEPTLAAMHAAIERMSELLGVYANGMANMENRVNSSLHRRRRRQEPTS